MPPKRRKPTGTRQLVGHKKIRRTQRARAPSSGDRSASSPNVPLVQPVVSATPEVPTSSLLSEPSSMSLPNAAASAVPQPLQVSGIAHELMANHQSGPAYVWIIGSSLISRAYQHVKTRPMGENLSLIRNGYIVSWAGCSGLQFQNVIGVCQALLDNNSSMGLSPPTYLMVHAGGNDIGRIPTGALREYICSVLVYLKILFPFTTIVWSSILPRLNWRYSDNSLAMEKARSRINRAAISAIIKQGGRAIKYPDFDDKHPALFLTEHIYLSWVMIFS